MYICTYAFYLFVSFYVDMSCSLILSVNNASLCMFNLSVASISWLLAITLLFLHVQSSPCYLCPSHISTPMLVFMSVAKFFAHERQTTSIPPASLAPNNTLTYDSNKAYWEVLMRLFTEHAQGVMQE